MPKAKSERQRMAAGVALAAKRGKKPKEGLRAPSRKMAESMSEEELRQLASSPDKPAKKS